ncbi:MAG: type II toxin-antitoxin system VapC family toxin [Treponema sp.]|nr:type II toxin-antitoxin system VapC family toxin [Treponema sp.]
MDSNVIIGFLANKIPAAGMKFVSNIVDELPHISVISKIEVLRFRDIPENEAVLADFIERSEVCPLSPTTVQCTIELCRQSRIKLPDAIIAATALDFRAPL